MRLFQAAVLIWAVKRDGVTQPMSMIAIVSGITIEDIKEFVITGEDTIEPKKRLHAEIKKSGISISYTMPTLMYIRDNLFGLYTNHEYGVKVTSADDLTNATFRSRAEVNKIVGSLRSLGGRWKNIRIVATSSHIGVREGRRVHGLYTLTEEDLANGAKFDDAVCRVNFNVDVHAPKKNEGGGYSTVGFKSKPYDYTIKIACFKRCGRTFNGWKVYKRRFYCPCKLSCKRQCYSHR